MRLPDTTVGVSAQLAMTHDYSRRSSWKNDMDDHSLYQCAWAMQERETAHHIIYFLLDEVLWHCATATCYECGLSSFDRFTRPSALPGFSELLQNGYGPHSGPQLGIV
jgi:hypothetical protein